MEAYERKGSNTLVDNKNKYDAVESRVQNLACFYVFKWCYVINNLDENPDH